MPSTAGATIGIPPVRAVDEADLSVRQPRDEERNLQLPEEVYQMESVFPRNIYLGTHDWRQVLMFEGDFCLPFRLFTRYLKKRVKIKVSVSFNRDEYLRQTVELHVEEKKSTSIARCILPSKIHFSVCMRRYVQKMPFSFGDSFGTS
jgi:hypothetical protein